MIFRGLGYVGIFRRIRVSQGNNEKMKQTIKWKVGVYTGS